MLSSGLASLLLPWSCRPPDRCGRRAGFSTIYGARLRASRRGRLAMDAYATKSNRGEVFAPLIARLASGASLLGFPADDFPEISLWKLFGSRPILPVKTPDSTEATREGGTKMET